MRYSFQNTIRNRSCFWQRCVAIFTNICVIFYKSPKDDDKTADDLRKRLDRKALAKINLSVYNVFFR